ncbi:hypothetical protein [uncultured Bacteroides sp.]|uniref:hypothetical protein n=1 Tax=uncultured Bacteroides sp. TaxID=162156 RepID=UPI002AA78AE2|nr:hypothetical protein [uncultured Bacteroides sp.]
MKKSILLIAMIALSAIAQAQSEITSDSITNMNINKSTRFGDFLLDVNLYAMPVHPLPSFTDLLKTTPSMENLLESINRPSQWVFTRATPDALPSLVYAYDSPYSSFPAQDLGMGTIKLNDKLKLNLYGQYAPDGSKLPGTNLFPWNKNEFKAGMELKVNDHFGVHVEVQRGGYNPYLY